MNTDSINGSSVVKGGSVDQREVAFYTAMAEKWWDREGPFWPLHVLNELRVEYIRRVVCEKFNLDNTAAQPLAGLEILDIGCGGGILSEPMARLGARVTGIDVVERNIAIARSHARQGGIDIEYQLITAERLAEQGAQHDVVLNMEVVEHVANISTFLHAAASLVRPGGSMFLATINRNFLSWLVAIVGAEYVFRLLPKGTHRWRQFRKPWEIEAYLTQASMIITASVGVRVNPLTRRMALTNFMGVNYMLVAQKFEEQSDD